MRHYFALFILMASFIGKSAFAQTLPVLQPINNANAANIQLLETLNTGSDAATLSWSPDGTILAVATESKILLYDTNDLHLAPRRFPLSQIISLVFSPDGQSIATSSNFGGTGMDLWDLKGIHLASFEDVQPSFIAAVPAVDMAFSPNGTILTSQHYLEHLGNIYDPWVRLWNVQTGELLAKIDGGGMSVTFSPDGNLLAGTTPGTVRVWDVDRILTTKPDDILLEDLVLNGNSILAFSDDSNQLAYLRDGNVQIWDITTEQIINLPGFVDELCMAKSPFPIILNQYQTQKYSVQLWDGCQNVLVATLDGYTDVIVRVGFNPDNTLLATANRDGIVQLWGIPAD